MSARTMVLAAFTMLALSGCERRESPPLPEVAIERPTLTLPGTLGEHEKMLIPASALALRGGIPGVFILSDAGEARFIMVKAGRTRGTEIEILSGLAGGETLVLGDLAPVHDGTPIRKQ
jgi:hypothetical protein